MNTETTALKSARFLILTAIAVDPKTAKEIESDIHGTLDDCDNFKQISENLRSCADESLVVRRNDNGSLIYLITEKGLNWLKNKEMLLPIKKSSPSVSVKKPVLSNKTTQTKVTPMTKKPASLKQFESKIHLQKINPESKKPPKEQKINGNYVIIQEGSRIVMKELNRSKRFATSALAAGYADKLASMGRPASLVIQIIKKVPSLKNKNIVKK